MENVEQTQATEEIQEQSIVLDEQEVQEAVTEEQPKEEEVKLPSEDEGELIAGKFKSQEDLVNAYKELEKKIGAPKEETPPADNKVAETINNNLSQYVDEYQKNGELSEESMKQLKEAGMNEDQIQDAIDYYQYKADKQTEELLKPFGTKQDFEDAALWAKDSWTEEQVTLFNTQLAKADKETAQALLTGLFSGYNASKGSSSMDDVLHTNTPATPERVKGYATKSEFLKDSADPRYGKDHAYTKAVEAKMGLTDMGKWYEDIPRGG
jgi:hypothetical protein